MQTSQGLLRSLFFAVLLSACHCAELNYSGPLAEWPEYGSDHAGSRHSPLEQITRQNVSSLKVAWTYHSGDISDGNGNTTTSSLQVTPIVVDDVMYFCTPFN